MSLLIKNATVVTLGENNKILPQHNILIEEDKIKTIEPANQSSLAAQTVIDAQGKLLLPGFINAHMHYYSSFARGLAPAPSYNFKQVLENLWWKLDKCLDNEANYLSAMIANISAIKHGTTTIIDHHSSPSAISGSLQQVARAVKDSGLRANLCYEISDRDGAEKTIEGLAESEAFLDFITTNKDPQLRGLVGLHASFTLQQGTMNKAAQLMEKFNSGVHIHCAEDFIDQIETMQMTKQRVVERLFDLGMLNHKTILAHGIYLNDHELNLIAENDTSVVINTQSNMNNAVGTSDLVKMSELGIRVGLGTDAMTSNMLEELRTALWQSKLYNKNPQIGFMEVTNALLHGNRQIANIHWKGFGLGEIKEGAVADLALIDYYAPTPFTADTFLGHLVFGISQERVHTTIASGKVLMHNYQLTSIDEAAIMAQAQEKATQIWQQFKK